MRTLILSSLLTLSAFAQTTPAAPASNSTWERLHILLGTWKAQTSAQGAARAQSVGTYTFQSDLNGNVITRTSSTDACKGPSNFDCQHHDSLTIYHDTDDTTPHALYADSEGHVIHYDVSAPDPNTVILLSNTPGPKFRLVYHFEGGIMSGKFQFAPPGTSEFKSYLEWSGTRL
ncbi:MAG: hypothetical protein WDN23_10065 [Edaphobacter sp.]